MEHDSWFARSKGAVSRRAFLRMNAVGAAALSTGSLPRLAAEPLNGAGNVDAWDGYVAARNRLLGFVDEEDIRNLKVLTGDIHSSWVADLKADFAFANSPVVASEFVGTSITSDFPPSFIPIIQAALLDPANRHVKFFDGAQHGYVRCTITPEQWRSDYRVVDTILQPSANVRTLQSFVVDNDRPGARLL